MADGQPSSLSVAYLGRPGSRAAGVTDEIATAVHQIDTTTIDEVETAFKQARAAHVDCLVCDGTVIREGGEIGQRVRHLANDLPTIVLVEGTVSPLLKSPGQQLVTEFISIDSVEPEVVKSRLERHITWHQDRASTTDSEVQPDRFNILFEHFPEPTIAYRFDGDVSRILAVNTAFERVFGFDSHEAVGMEVDALLAPDDRRDEAAELDQRVRCGELIDAEVRRRTSTGDRYFRFRNIELPDDDIYDGIAIYADINEQYHREHTLSALHATSRKLSRAQTPAEIADIATDASGEIIGIPLTGVWLADKATGDLDPAALSPALQDLLNHRPTLSRGEPPLDATDESSEQYIEDTSEIDTWPESLAPIGSAFVLPLGAHGVFIIASESPDAIDEIHRSSARILVANTQAALDRADREVAIRRNQEELKRQNERLEEFTQVVSHDLRTPLAVASASLEQLRAEHDELDLSHIDEALTRMETIISKTLTLARSGETSGETQPVDIGVLARTCQHVLSTVDGKLAVEDGLPTVQADPDHLRHVFENLFRNAAEHAGPSVTVSIRPIDGGFAVGDDGPGIPADVRDRIFETGYSTTDEGTGFGLAIVRRIAEAYGWSVSIDTAPDGGALFCFTGLK